MRKWIARVRRTRQPPGLRPNLAKWFGDAPLGRVSPLVAAATAWALARCADSPLQQGLRVVTRLCNETAPRIKELTVCLRSVKRPWSCRLWVRIRVKW